MKEAPAEFLGEDSKKTERLLRYNVEKAIRLVDFVNTFGVHALYHLPKLNARYRNGRADWKLFMTRTVKMYEREMNKRFDNREEKRNFLKSKVINDLQQLGYPRDHFPFLDQEAPFVEFMAYNNKHMFIDVSNKN